MKKPPKDINSIFGYRTAKSSSSQKAWDYAQHIAGKYMIIAGVINLVVFTIVGFIYKNSEHYNNIFLYGSHIQLVIILMIIPITEFRLSKYIKSNSE